MTLVATLVVWSSHCWTRDYVSYAKRFLVLKTSLHTFLKHSPWQPVNKTVTVAIYLCFHHKSLWKSPRKTATFKDRRRLLQPLHLQSHTTKTSKHLGDDVLKSHLRCFVWFLWNDKDASCCKWVNFLWIKVKGASCIILPLMNHYHILFEMLALLSWTCTTAAEETGSLHKPQCCILHYVPPGWIKEEIFRIASQHERTYWLSVSLPSRILSWLLSRLCYRLLTIFSLLRNNTEGCQKRE